MVLFVRTRKLGQLHGLSWHQMVLNVRIWGCPVYVLDPTLLQGAKLPKWQPHSCHGIFVWFSLAHSSDVPLVFNPPKRSRQSTISCCLWWESQYHQLFYIRRWTPFVLEWFWYWWIPLPYWTRWWYYSCQFIFRLAHSFRCGGEGSWSCPFC